MTLKSRVQKVALIAVLAGCCFLLLGLSMAAAAWIQISSVVKGREVDVPDLYGMSLDQARERAESMGLILVQDPNSVHSDVVAEGQILFQVPQPHRHIKSGRRLEVTVSLGPEIKKIPNLTGESVNFAGILLKQAETVPGQIARIPSGLAPKGRILAQNPPGGSELGLMSGVSLLVSDGPVAPYYVTPNLTGKSYPLVKKFLDDNDFRVVVKIKGGDPSQVPTVLRQYPQAGYPIQKNHPITLEINRE
ncbi:MAG: PASTA domain-containing protein [Acidobacteria bacterium]|nr:PASTA domain-containing protein [Acidobacteriota bacterium]